MHDQHIVSVYGSGEWKGSHYIVLGYVAGPSLRSLIRDQTPLDPARAIELTMQLLLAVRYIHGRGIVHGDLEPDNVIPGVCGEVKLADFGIARFRVSEAR